MISPKLAILMATMAVIGAACALPMAPMALAQNQESAVDIERNNEIIQSNRQFQEACIGVAGPANIDDGDVVDIDSVNRAEVEQGPNVCEVAQNQEATNTAAIVDESVNTFELTQDIINFDCAFVNGQFVCR